MTPWLVYAFVSAVGTAPAASLATGCGHNQVAARIVEPVAATPELTFDEQLKSARVNLSVQLDARGDVKAVTMSKSSGSKMMDYLATQFAMRSRYAPELRSCRAVSGTYELDVVFTALTATDGGTQVETHGRLIGTLCQPDRPVARLGSGDLGTVIVPHGVDPERGIVVVDVTVDAQGRPVSSAVSKSAGLVALNAFAQRVAMKSTYSPAISDCQPVASSYAFQFRFDR